MIAFSGLDPFLSWVWPDRTGYNLYTLARGVPLGLAGAP